MPEAQHSVTIQRPIEEVFDFVADGEKCTQWRPGVLDITRVSGDGPGTIYRQGVKGPMGRRIAADYQVTMLQRPNLIEFHTIAGPVRPQGRYELAAVDGGTRLTFSLRAEVSGLRKLLMGSMVARTMGSEVRSLERLKRVLEA
jgi:carbon monoxide dehydrogenase subunit G